MKKILSELENCYRVTLFYYHIRKFSSNFFKIAAENWLNVGTLKFSMCHVIRVLLVLLWEIQF